MQARQITGELPVGLLRPWRINIIGAKAGFYVAYGNPRIECRERSSKSSRCISVDQHIIGLEVVQYVAHSLKNPRGNAIQVLAGPHNVQIILRRDGEKLQYLVEHVAMLASYAYPCVEFVMCVKRIDNWCHFDGFGPGPKNCQNFHSSDLLQRNTYSGDSHAYVYDQAARNVKMVR